MLPAPWARDIILVVATLQGLDTYDIETTAPSLTPAAAASSFALRLASLTASSLAAAMAAEGSLTAYETRNSGASEHPSSASSSLPRPSSPASAVILMPWL